MDEPRKRDLTEAAVLARDFAYAPYSEFRVGAAVLAKSGEVFSGCNVENASYGLCFCAERTAIVKAVSEGEQAFLAIAVATAGGGTPCGSCRQFIAEFCDGQTIVIVHDVTANKSTEYVLEELLPNAFRL